MTQSIPSFGRSSAVRGVGEILLEASMAGLTVLASFIPASKNLGGVGGDWTRQFDREVVAVRLESALVKTKCVAISSPRLDGSRACLKDSCSSSSSSSSSSPSSSNSSSSRS